MIVEIKLLEINATVISDDEEVEIGQSDVVIDQTELIRVCLEQTNKLFTEKEER